MARLTTALASLSSFAKNEDVSTEDLRGYIADNASELADHFSSEVLSLFATAEDDNLRTFVRAAIDRAAKDRRAAAALERARNAQASADVLSVMCERRNGRDLEIDALSLFASCLTTPKAHLFIHMDGPAVAFPMRPLLDTAAVILDSDRAPTVRAWLDGTTLRVRWTNTRGTASGFNWHGTACGAFVYDLEDRETVYVADGRVMLNHPEDVHMHAPPTVAPMTTVRRLDTAAANDCAAE